MKNDLTVKMKEVRELMDEKGFSSDDSSFWEKLTLIHSELSEAADAYRKGADYYKVGEELVDALVRLLHLLSILKQDPEQLYKKVMDNNRQREKRWNTERGA